jgi:hypothetical protein
MGAARSRLWVIGGLVVALVMVATSWFFLIHPQRSQASTLHEQAVAAQDRLIPLRRQLTDLQTRTARLPGYKAELDRVRQALPTETGMADFLRTLQTIGDQTSVAVSDLVVGDPVQLTKTEPVAFGLGLAVTAAGTLPALMRFLDQLQLEQPRAVLISSVDLAPGGQTQTLTNAVKITLSLQAFMSPSGGTEQPAGAPAPSTPTPSATN